MARSENPPIGRGQTMDWYDDETPGSSINATGGAHLEGKEWMFEDLDYANLSNGIAPARSGKFVFCRLVRNKSGAALLPKRFAQYKADGTTADIFGGQVSGYGDTVGQVGGVVDEFLPAAGVPNNALFWLVVEGPTIMTTAASGDTNIGLGVMVIPSTDGKVIEQNTGVAAGAATFNQIQGAIGRSLLAVNATDSDIPVYVRRML